MLRKLFVFLVASLLIVAGLTVGRAPTVSASPYGLLASSYNVTSGDLIYIQAAFSNDESGFTVVASPGTLLGPYGCSLNGLCFSPGSMPLLSQVYPYNGQVFGFNYGLYGQNYAFGNYFALSDAQVQSRDMDTINSPFTVLLTARVNCVAPGPVFFTASQEFNPITISVFCNPVLIAPPASPIIVQAPAPTPVVQQQIIVRQEVPVSRPSVISPPRTGDGGLKYIE